MDYLGPNEMPKFGGFNESELKQLKQYFETHSSLKIKWGLLSFRFPGRTGKDCLNAYVTLMKKVGKKRLIDVTKTNKIHVNSTDIIQTNLCVTNNDTKNIKYLETILNKNDNQYSTLVFPFNYQHKNAKHKHLFVTFKHANVKSKLLAKIDLTKDNNDYYNDCRCIIQNIVRKVPSIAKPHMYNLDDCDIETKDIINADIQSLINQFDAEKSITKTRQKLQKLRDKFNEKSEDIFLKHTFMMGVSLSSLNIQVPKLVF